MVELTVSDLHTVFNWAFYKASSSRNSLSFKPNEERAQRIHNAYDKAAAGRSHEITIEELSDVAYVALDVEFGSTKGTPKYETAKGIFHKANTIRKALEREGG